MENVEKSKQDTCHILSSLSECQVYVLRQPCNFLLGQLEDITHLNLSPLINLKAEFGHLRFKERSLCLITFSSLLALKVSLVHGEFHFKEISLQRIHF